MTSAKGTQPTFNELFAGVGGFRLGLEASGWAHAWSNQYEPTTKVQHASDCYVANFGHDDHENRDIAIVANELLAGLRKIPKADLLVGGFPCQDYSVAKSRSSARGLEGKKGVLWWEILKVINFQKPKVILLENVDRLLTSPSHQKGRDFAVMLRTLADCGYFIEWRIINAADYGFPQRRKRVFVFAWKKALRRKISNPFDSTVNRAFPIDNLEELSNFPLEADPELISNEFGKASKSSPFRNWGWFDGNTVFTARVNPKIEQSKYLRSVLVHASKVPPEYWVGHDDLEQWEFLKDKKSLDRTTSSGFSYKYSEGKMAFPDSLDKPSRTILTGEGGKTPSRFKHIICVNGKYRRLTPIELERLNGFPDDWTRYGVSGKELTDAKRAFFMGNALVVGVIERLGKQIFKEFF